MSEEKYKEQIDNLMNSFINLANTYNDVNSKLTKRIMNAIDYIKERFEINEYGEYYFTHTFDNSNMKELLEILGGKENESS